MTAKQFREIRRRLGMTQVSLAETIGVTVRTIKRWESGESGVSEPAARLAETLTTKRGAKNGKQRTR